MDPIAAELTAALRERLTIVADEVSRRDGDQHIQRLREISERIESLKAKLPAPVHPQLVHYLQRASYTKALEFLEGRGDNPTANTTPRSTAR